MWSNQPSPKGPTTLLTKEPRRAVFTDSLKARHHYDSLIAMGSNWGELFGHVVWINDTTIMQNIAIETR